ncbi:MAG: hypothetical protein QOJ50_2413 [Cryptosporangiaceae bacterium]|nr:hypothetical protein [Cryptosporangiaceae bacterium]
MKTQRAQLTPQMLTYDDFDDRSEVRYLPYLMYFHRADFRSEVINTDRLGFRLSHGSGGTASVGGDTPDGPVRLLAGTSTVLGLGATSDAATMASRLWTEHAPSKPWLNFGGRSLNSAQNLLLYTLHRHLLPPVEEIVYFDGFNNLALARLPEWQRGENGAFFFCGEYYDAMDDLRASARKAQGRRKADKKVPAEEGPRPLADVIADAAALTARHLDTLKAMTAADGTKLTYVLQPLATWLRDEPAPQEKLLFDELDRISKMGTWEKLYGEISTPEAGAQYADALRAELEKKDIGFVDFTPILRSEVSPADWLYVDRAHFTDLGNDVVARLLAETLTLS